MAEPYVSYVKLDVRMFVRTRSASLISASVDRTF